MAFKWVDPNDRMDGEGTLKEYFSPATWALDPNTTFGTVDDSDLEERDSAIDRLQLQLFTEFSHIGPDTHVKVRWVDDEYPLIETDEEGEAYEAQQRAEFLKAAKQPGLNLVCVHPDDPIVCLFKDGKPLAAFYASYRGVYQAGGFSLVRNQHYVADNFTGSTPDEWRESDGDYICASIARRQLLGEASQI